MIGSSIAIVASGPMPGSTPISVPRKHADEAEPQVLQRQRDAEAENQIIEEFHVSIPSMPKSGYGRPRP